MRLQPWLPLVFSRLSRNRARTFTEHATALSLRTVLAGGHKWDPAEYAAAHPSPDPKAPAYKAPNTIRAASTAHSNPFADLTALTQATAGAHVVPLLESTADAAAMSLGDAEAGLMQPARPFMVADELNACECVCAAAAAALPPVQVSTSCCLCFVHAAERSYT